MSRLRSLLVGIGISAAATALLVATTDLGQVAAQLKRTDVAWLLPGLLVLAAQAWIRATRWASLLRPAAPVSRPIRAAGVVDAMLIGYFVNAVLPARLGEVARTILVARRHDLPFAGVIGSVVVERAIDVMALAALAAAALALATSDAAIAFAALGLGIAMVIAAGRRATILERLLPTRMPARVGAGVRTFLAAVAAIPPSAALGAAALSTVAWLADAALVLLVSRALGIEISVAAAIAIALGGALGTALPAAPGYLATYELGAVALGSLAGVPRETVLPLAILTHLVGVTVLAVAGAVALGRAGGLSRLDGLARGAADARALGRPA